LGEQPSAAQNIYCFDGKPSASQKVLGCLMKNLVQREIFVGKCRSDFGSAEGMLVYADLLSAAQKVC
jgi:hypothetical protein